MNTKKNFEVHHISGRRLPFIFNVNSRAGTDTGAPFIHWHPNIEIMYVIEGEGYVFCGSSEYNVTRGDIFLVNSNLIHYHHSDTSMKYYYLIIDNEFCLYNDIDTDSITFDAMIKDPEAVHLFKDVIAAYSKNTAYKNACIKAAVLNLLLCIAQKHTDLNSGTGKGSIGNENIKLAIGYIKSHFAERLTLDILSREVGLSKYHFLREFKSCTGCTPISYINSLRCDHAKKLLSDGAQSIREVGESCGFENFSYFSKTFKNSAGCTPSEYAKSKRGNV